MYDAKDLLGRCVWILVVKPCIRGLRITVYDVLSYLAAGMTHDQILADFPFLTEDDILACLSFAAQREQQMLAAKA